MEIKENIKCFRVEKIVVETTRTRFFTEVFAKNEKEAQKKITDPDFHFNSDNSNRRSTADILNIDTTTTIEQVK